ncbi:electron transfer flavoprotein subunit alpha, partial [Oceanisphaera arctica]
MSELNRRDPRLAWILRNRLHPRHDELNGQPTRGPTGLLRKNPRPQWQYGPSGLRRLDRLNMGGAAGVTQLSSKKRNEQPVLPLHQVVEPQAYIAVWLQTSGGRLTSHCKDVLGQAQQLAVAREQSTAVLGVLCGELKESVEGAGIDRLLQIQGPEYDGYQPEAWSQLCTQVETALKPLYWLLPDSGESAELGRRLGVALGERPATGVWKLEADTLLA